MLHKQSVRNFVLVLRLLLNRRRRNPKVVFSLFETVKLSVSISPRNLYIS